MGYVKGNFEDTIRRMDNVAWLRKVDDSSAFHNEFEANADADNNERLHFIPVYVENGNYIVSVTATQIWTPAGMITATRNSNTVNINGTIYDDWYQG